MASENFISTLYDGTKQQVHTILTIRKEYTENGPTGHFEES